MRYEIVFSREFLRQLEQLPGNIKAMARHEIATLEHAPRPLHSKELDDNPNYYRVWLGPNHRLVWFVDDESQLIRLRYVGRKTPDLYRRLGLDRFNAIIIWQKLEDICAIFLICAKDFYVTV